jgi:shikimate kinase
VKIFLIGFMGAGKSTAGRKLAKRLQFSFLDTDTCIEDQEGLSITRIFAEKGEEYFREAESRILKRVAGSSGDTVVSTGGGAPCYRDNMNLMNVSGVTVYLKLPPGILYQRLVGSYRKNRPLIRDKSPQELLEYITEKLNEREAYYNRSRIIVSAEFIHIHELEKTIRGIMEDS